MLFFTILTLILLLTIVGMYIYYEKKLYSTKQQLIFTSNSYKKLKDELNSKKLSNNIYIKFNTPASNIGLTNNKVNILLAPYKQSPIINNIQERVQVPILDEAEINNEIWYYVSLPINTNINSKGWINKRDFNLIMNNLNK